MIIGKNDNWYCCCINIDDYMNLFFYKEEENRIIYDNFGYQNMFVTLEIRNEMYLEDY